MKIIKGCNASLPNLANVGIAPKPILSSNLTTHSTRLTPNGAKSLSVLW